MTIKQHIDAAIEATTTYRGEANEISFAAGREFSLAITALEDAQMRATRGLAMLQGKFSPADLEAEAVRPAPPKPGEHTPDPNTIHTYPVNDTREHETDGAPCWCDPKVETVHHDDGEVAGTVVVHNSADGREHREPDHDRDACETCRAAA